MPNKHFLDRGVYLIHKSTEEKECILKRARVQFNLRPSKFMNQFPSPNLAEIKFYFYNYSHIVINTLDDNDKLNFIENLLVKFPSGINIMLCANKINDISDYKSKRIPLWELLITTLLDNNNLISEKDYIELLDLIKSNSDLINKDLITQFYDCILSLNDKLSNTNYNSILVFLLCQNEINYDLLKSKKLHSYYKKNICFTFKNVINKNKLDVLSFTLDEFPTAKNIKFIFNELPKIDNYFKEKRIVLDKLYNIVSTKKIVGLKKSDYISFLIKSVRDVFNEKIFEYMFANFKLDFSECLNLLQMKIKESCKKTIVDYIILNFDLDKRSSKRLLQFPMDSYARQILLKNIMVQKPSFNYLKSMYLFEAYKLILKEELLVIIMDLYPSNMINYLEKEILSSESLYDYESDYQIELEIISYHTKNINNYRLQ